MQEFLEYIVEKPEEIKISEGEDDKGPYFLVELSEEDKPLVIGKGGRNIRAIRQITSILARKEDKRIYIKIAD